MWNEAPELGRIAVGVGNNQASVLVSIVEGDVVNWKDECESVIEASKELIWLQGLLIKLGFIQKSYIVIVRVQYI